MDCSGVISILSIFIITTTAQTGSPPPTHFRTHPTHNTRYTIYTSLVLMPHILMLILFADAFFSCPLKHSIGTNTTAVLSAQSTVQQWGAALLSEHHTLKVTSGQQLHWYVSTIQRCEDYYSTSDYKYGMWLSNHSHYANVIQCHVVELCCIALYTSVPIPTERHDIYARVHVRVHVTNTNTVLLPVAVPFHYTANMQSMLSDTGTHVPCSPAICWHMHNIDGCAYMYACNLGHTHKHVHIHTNSAHAHKCILPPYPPRCHSGQPIYSTA